MTEKYCEILRVVARLHTAVGMRPYEALVFLVLFLVKSQKQSVFAYQSFIVTSPFEKDVKTDETLSACIRLRELR